MQVLEEKETSIETSLAGSSVLIVPGWNGSGAGHWQTLWEQKYPRFRRVEQHNWSRPSRSDWMAQIAYRHLSVHLRPCSVVGPVQPGVRGRGALGRTLSRW